MIKLVNQPFEGQLGNILIDKLSEDKYKSFVIVSAFAKNSGVLRIKDSIKDFRDNGGKVEAFIGLDAHGTSYEALCNLFSIVDNLYIVHDNNPAVTFHSKIYCLTDFEDNNWIAVGSNNLTGGGLWTNIESSTIIDVNSPTDYSVEFLDSFMSFVSVIKSDSCEYSMKINDIEDLDKLLENDLLRHEIQLQISAAKSRRLTESKENTNTGASLFGTIGKIQIPTIKEKPKGKKVKIKERNLEITSTEPIVPSNNAEKMWFETREMTGGSRNILDLSMLGTIVMGDGNGTRYETSSDSAVLGSVVFFDVDPTNTSIEKNITINYRATDYFGCTIKMHLTGDNPNGSWRIQLKGESATGDKLTTAEDGHWFVHKIIVLEKIRSDYYVMSVLSENELDNLKSKSIFVARNGRNSASKQYGLLDI
ncbi:MAG: phospholipase D family protein [Ruminococcus sp.]|uniref:phospholipase D family protein n=1 Tax=Ruminococcus sp. TaxID=41978 RepID=UPI0025F1BFD0|nr:phospholipase D family protein [Ruminococcus sp.]MBO4867451.1 phospholipase D family protein [Ruminococcus sp.]